MSTLRDTDLHVEVMALGKKLHGTRYKLFGGKHPLQVGYTILTPAQYYTTTDSLPREGTTRSTCCIPTLTIRWVRDRR